MTPDPLSAKGLVADGEGEPSAPSVSPARPLPIDFPAALARLDGNVDLLQELLSDFLQDGPDALKQLRQVAVSGDPDLLERFNHRVKGVSSLIGATTLEEATRRFERSLREGKTSEWPHRLREIDCAYEEVLRYLVTTAL